MKVACISDLHGYLPDLSGLDFDLLVIGGDITPLYHKHAYKKQGVWLSQTFEPWLKNIRKPVIGVAGNHDGVFQHARHLVPELLPWIYLQDEGAEVLGLKIWGSPWQQTFHNWHFNLPELDLAQKWEMIPEGLDVLLLHSPPFGYGDRVHFYPPVGSPSLTQAIFDKKPRLVVFGHIHDGYGLYYTEDSLLVNASYVDEQYRPGNPVQVIEL